MGNSNTSIVSTDSKGFYYIIKNDRQILTVNDTVVNLTPLIVYAYDKYHKPVKNASITFTSSTPNLIFSSKTLMTNSKGRVKLDVSIDPTLFTIPTGFSGYQIFFTVNIKDILFSNNYFYIFINKLT